MAFGGSCVTISGGHMDFVGGLVVFTVSRMAFSCCVAVSSESADDLQ